MGAISFERCKTGIVGFDNITEGGLIRNSVNVLLGGPGAGKTTFLLNFLWNGATMFGENGLFISFEPDVDNLFQDGMNYGWNFSALESKGFCKFIKLSPKTNIRDLKTELTSLISRGDIRRVCFDPISILTMEMEKEVDIREMIFDLTSLLKRLNVTVLLSDESIEGSTSVCSSNEGQARTEAMKFLCDGLIVMYSSGLGGETDRAIRVTKMRRTNHVRGPVPFKITDKGIYVLNDSRN